MPPKFQKLKPSDVTLDVRFQRELDEARAKAMSKHVDFDRLGVPVVSRRADGTCVVVDGQHRLSAMAQANLGHTAILCEVHEGLSLKDEASLFLALNGGRRPVRVFDKFKARLIAQEPVAIEISKIVERVGLKITKSQQKNGVCAIRALESVFHQYQNLAKTLDVLIGWSDGNTDVYEGEFIKAVGYFLAHHPDVVVEVLVERMMKYAPQRLNALIMRERGTLGGDLLSYDAAADRVIATIYSYKNRKHSLKPRPAVEPREHN